MDFGAINVRTFMPNYQKNPTVKEEEGVGSDNESQSCKKTTFKSYYSVFYNIYILLSLFKRYLKLYSYIKVTAPFTKVIQCTHTVQSNSVINLLIFFLFLLCKYWIFLF